MVEKWKNENNVLFKQKTTKHLIIFERNLKKKIALIVYIFVTVHIKTENYFFFDWKNIAIKKKKKDE